MTFIRKKKNKSVYTVIIEKKSEERKPSTNEIFINMSRVLGN